MQASWYVTALDYALILAEATGKRGACEFIMTEPARCATCKHIVTEKTLVDPK